MRCGAAGCGRRRILLDAEQEFRRHEHRLDGRLDAALEIARCRAAPCSVERVQRLDVGARHRPPERAARERGENGSRARRLLRAAVRGGTRKSSAGSACRRARSASYGPPTISLLISGVVARHVESLQPGAVQSQVDGRRDLRRAAASAARAGRRGASLSGFRFSRGDVTPTVCSPAFTATRTWYGSVSACSPSACTPRNRTLKTYSASSGK